MIMKKIKQWKFLLLVFASGFLLFASGFSKLLVNIGNIYLYQNDLANAERYYSLSTFDANKIPGIRGFGLVSLREGDFDTALEAYNVVLNQNESDLFSRLERAEIKFLLGDKEGANQDWLLTNPKVLERLGVTAIDLQEWTEAENFFRLKIALQPEDPNGYYLLGLVLQKQGLNKLAMDIWLQGLSIAPNNELLLLRYGQLKYESEEFLDAINIFSKSIAINPSKFNGWYWRGLSYKKLREYELAKEDFIKATQLNPEDINPIIHLARTYESLGEWEFALKEYQRVLYLKPEHNEGILAIMRLQDEHPEN
jgi:tetratricopeptide (TPR) repeat protein